MPRSAGLATVTAGAGGGPPPGGCDWPQAASIGASTTTAAASREYGAGIMETLLPANGRCCNAAGSIIPETRGTIVAAAGDFSPYRVRAAASGRAIRGEREWRWRDRR